MQSPFRNIRPRLWCFFAVATFCIPVSAAFAQGLAPGTRMRISHHCQTTSSDPRAPVTCRGTKGSLDAVTRDSLYLMVPGRVFGQPTVRIGLSRDAIRTFEVRVRGNRRVAGAVTGMLLGTIVGFGVALVGTSICEGPDPGFLDCVGWVVAMQGMRLYIESFAKARYNETYGALGGVVVLLVWFYMTGTLLLTGGQINGIIHRAAVGDDDT